MVEVGFAAFFEISRMLLIHRQRHVEEDPCAELRAFIGLDVMHDRIHVYDDDILFFSNDGRKRHKAAIPRFNAWARKGGRTPLPFLEVFKIPPAVPKSSRRSDVERLQQSPPMTV